MSTTPFYLQKFENINGTPCAGGKLRAYVQGTSTPVNLYLDAALTVIAPRPLVLDAQGYVPQFWVSSAAGILFELRQADDVLVWTRDYVQASGGGGGGGTVLSVTAELDAGLSTAMAITSEPVTTSGAITIEGVEGLPHLALMTPVVGVGKPSMREVETSDVSGLDGALASFLPLAGGTMEDHGQIQYAETADDFDAGMYWGGTDWARISRWGLIWINNENRSGISLYPTEGAGSFFALKRKGFGAPNDVEIYGHGDGGYANFRGTTGWNSVSLGAEPGSGNGSLNVQNGAGEWTLSQSSSSSDVTLSTTRVRTLNATTELQVNYTTRIDNLGRAFITNATISNLTNGSLPIAGVDGLLGNSSLSEDAVGLKASKPLTLANATRMPWQTGHQAFQINAASALWEATAGTRFGRGIYFDGLNFRFANSVDSATMFSVFAAGGITLETTLAASVADDAIPDLAVRWGVDKTGKMTATAISISTPVTREAIIQPLPITNAAPGSVTVGPSGGVKSFGFDGGASTEELFYHLDVQHDYVSGTNMIFHVHWTPATATGGDVKLQIEYQWVEGGATWPTPTSASVVTAAGTTAWADKRSDITISGTGHTYNSRVLIRLFRVPTDASDTYAGDAVLTSVGLHYSADIGQP